MQQYKDYVGVMDSGLGGISVLREIVRLLPEENILYYGDSANAPYGERTKEEIAALTLRIVDWFVEVGCKAVVIACNTATSAAIEEVRAKYQDSGIPILGVEPALKPAAEGTGSEGVVLVMATPATLHLEKFHELFVRFAPKTDIVIRECPGLAARIEEGNLDAPDVVELLDGLVGDLRGKISCVVLGCTHYPFVRSALRKVLGSDIPLIDGAAGTARQLDRQLRLHGIRAAADQKGRVDWHSSIDTPEEIALYQKFMEMPID